MDERFSDRIHEAEEKMNEIGSEAPKIVIKAMIEPAIQWFEVYSKGKRSLSEGVTRFTTGQAQRTADTLAAMMSGNPVKALEAQQQWMVSTMHSYNEEVRRAMTLGSELAQEYLDRMNRRAGSLVPMNRDRD